MMMFRRLPLGAASLLYETLRERDASRTPTIPTRSIQTMEVDRLPLSGNGTRSDVAAKGVVVSIDRRKVALPHAVADLPAVKPKSIFFTTTFMLDKSVPEVELLRTAYAAFNVRDADATLATMTPDITLPNGMEGGYVHGHQAVRTYWTKQWAVIHPHDEPISFHTEDSGQILVDVHQVVRDLAGTVLSDRHFGHRCTIEHGLIQTMEICLPLLSDH